MNRLQKLFLNILIPEIDKPEYLSLWDIWGIKFIIKNIVQGVEYDAEKDKFTISHLDISDELISKIVLEGKKYNLTETTFYRIKKQYGFPTREQLYTNVTQTCDVEAIKSDYFGGMKTKDIQHKYGLSTGSLYRIIKENQWRR